MKKKIWKILGITLVIVGLGAFIFWPSLWPNTLLPLWANILRVSLIISLGVGLLGWAVWKLNFYYTPPGKIRKRVFRFPLGRPLRKGHVIAFRFFEQGPRAEVSIPGWHFLPFVYFSSIWEIKEPEDMTEIKEDEVGIVTALDGEEMPAGWVISHVAVLCNNFTNGKFFLEHGYKGVQPNTLFTGLYPINTDLFKIERDDLVEVGPMEFLERDVQEIIFSAAEMREKRKANHDPGDNKVTIQSVGIATSSLGPIIPEKGGRYIAREPKPRGKHKSHQNFQNLPAALAMGIESGIQFAILEQRRFRINTRAISVKFKPQVVIGPRESGVLVYNGGEDPTEKDLRHPHYSARPTTIREGEKVKEIKILLWDFDPNNPPDKAKKGILKRTLPTGNHNVNLEAYELKKVDNTPIQVCWNGRSGSDFEAITVLIEGIYGVEIELEVVVQVLREESPLMVATVRDIDGLIKDVIDPNIRADLRTIALGTELEYFITSKGREEVRGKIEDELKPLVEEKHTILKSVRISDVDYTKDSNTAAYLAARARQITAGQEKKAVEKEIPVQVARRELLEKQGIAEAALISAKSGAINAAMKDAPDSAVAQAVSGVVSGIGPDLAKVLASFVERRSSQ